MKAVGDDNDTEHENMRSESASGREAEAETWRRDAWRHGGREVKLS